MAWFNEGFSTLRGQLQNFTREVLSEGNDSPDVDYVQKISALEQLVEAQQAELRALRNRHRNPRSESPAEDQPVSPTLPSTEPLPGTADSPAGDTPVEPADDGSSSWAFIEHGGAPSETQDERGPHQERGLVTKLQTEVARWKTMYGLCLEENANLQARLTELEEWRECSSTNLDAGTGSQHGETERLQEELVQLNLLYDKAQEENKRLTDKLKQMEENKDIQEELLDSEEQLKRARLRLIEAISASESAEVSSNIRELKRAERKLQTDISSIIDGLGDDEQQQFIRGTILALESENHILSLRNAQLESAVQYDQDSTTSEKREPSVSDYPKSSTKHYEDTFSQTDDDYDKLSFRSETIGSVSQLDLPTEVEVPGQAQEVPWLQEKKEIAKQLEQLQTLLQSSQNMPMNLADCEDKIALANQYKQLKLVLEESFKTSKMLLDSLNGRVAPEIEEEQLQQSLQETVGESSEWQLLSQAAEDGFASPATSRDLSAGDDNSTAVSMENEELSQPATSAGAHQFTEVDKNRMITRMQDLELLAQTLSQQLDVALTFREQEHARCLDLSEKLKEAEAVIISVQSQQEGPEREVERLRQHLINIEERYTEDAVEAETKIHELETQLHEQRDRYDAMMSLHKSQSIRGNQQIEALQSQNKLLAQQKDDALRKLSDAEDQLQKRAAALHNLQSVLETFQRDKQQEIAEQVGRVHRMVESEQRRYAELQVQMETLKEQLNEAKEALSAASRLGEQLDRKTQTINILNQEVTDLSAKLSNAKRQIDLFNREGQVDKGLVKNLIVGYLTTPTSHRHEVMLVIAKVLEFTEEDHIRIGTNPAQGGWFQRMLGRDASRPNSQSILEAFVHFMEMESGPRPTLSLLPPPETETRTLSPTPLQMSVGSLHGEEGIPFPSTSGAILRDVLRNDD